jgi:putative transposase
LSLAAMIDLYSRKVIGWSPADHLRAKLPAMALKMALHKQPAKRVVATPGVPYTSDGYQQLLASYGPVASMGRQRNCYDNAVMESFFGTLKTGATHHETFATSEEVLHTLFEYVELFHNRKQRHRTVSKPNRVRSPPK